MLKLPRKCGAGGRTCAWTSTTRACGRQGDGPGAAVAGVCRLDSETLPYADPTLSPYAGINPPLMSAEATCVAAVDRCDSESHDVTRFVTPRRHERHARACSTRRIFRSCSA